MKLLKKIIDIWAESNWIKTIEAERKKLEKAKAQVARHKFILDELLTEYFRLYPEKEES